MGSVGPGEKQAKKKRRWLRFGLGSLLAVVTLAAVLLGIWHYTSQPYLFEARQAALWQDEGATVEVLPAGHAWARALVGEENLATIESVDLRDIEITAETVSTLMALRQIRTLVLRADQLTPADINRLASIPSLESLVLDSTPLTTAELVPLLDQRANLGVLVIERHALSVLSQSDFQFLGSSVIDPLSAVSPAQRASMKNSLAPKLLEPVFLAKLDVPEDVTADYEALSQALRCLHHVQSVSFKGPQCAAKLLPTIKDWQHLEMVSISAARGDQPIGLQHLQAHPRLRRLYVEDADLSGADLVALASLHQLEDLHLENISVVPEHLSEIVKLENLKSLRLPATFVHGDNYRQLKQLESLRFLQVLGPITPDRKLELSTLLPNCTLVARGEAEIELTNN